MKTFIKKNLCAATVTVLIFLLSFSVFSAEVKTDESFYVYTEQTEKVCEILGVEENALESYFKQNNVTYFAVDKDNKRQIKLLEYKTDFSNSIVNISSMTSDNITVLIPEIIGIENAKGEVITQGEQKFIKTSVMTEDSGGEYILTSFTTVADRKNYSLNFYTLKGEDTDYIDGIFEQYAKSSVFFNTDEPDFSFQKILIFIGVTVSVAVFVLVGMSVIRDLKKPKEESEESKLQETIDENEKTE